MDASCQVMSRTDDDRNPGRVGARVSDAVVRIPRPEYGHRGSPASPTWGEASRAPIVLETKLNPPALRPSVVERRALLERILDTPLPVVVVEAPPGYGKTTLLAQC